MEKTLICEFHWEGIPDNEDTEELTDNSPRVSIMRKWIAELVNQNPNFTAYDIEKLMRNNNMDDKLILFVLGTEELETLKISTKTKLIEYMQEQNTNLTGGYIIRKMDEVTALDNNSKFAK